jgi:hypothetical protein
VGYSVGCRLSRGADVVTGQLSADSSSPHACDGGDSEVCRPGVAATAVCGQPGEQYGNRIDATHKGRRDSIPYTVQCTVHSVQ